MGRKLQLHDALGPFESRSNLYHLSDAHGALHRLKSEAHRFWDKDSDQHRKWVRVCDDLLKVLNQIRCRKAKCQRLEDVLSDIINTFCHTEYRIEELLSNPTHEDELASAQDWLFLAFRAAVFGTVRTWLPRAQQDPAVVDVGISIESGQVVYESIHQTPWKAARKYRRHK